VQFVLCLINYYISDPPNWFHPACSKSLEMCMLNEFHLHYGSWTKCYDCTFDHKCTNDDKSIPSKNHEIFHEKIMEQSNNKNVSTFTGHSSPHPSNSCLICLYYLLNTMFLNFLLSLTYLTLRLLFSLLTFSSESLFKCAEKLSHYLISLSNELDQIFWPYMIIRFPYMILNKLHILLATYFEEQLVSHFYEVNICTYAKTALYIGHTNKTCFNYCSYMSRFS